MRKLISSINITPDGFCDHTAVIADEELHENANELFSSADTILLGRVTYQLMESFWPSVAKKPTGRKSVDEFAKLIDNIPKIVFSRTLKNVEWKNTKIATESIKEEVLKLKQQPGKNILVGSPSIISELTKLGLIDEYYFLVQPILAGNGKRLFETINLAKHQNLKLIGKKFLKSGVVALHYQIENIV